MIFARAVNQQHRQKMQLKKRRFNVSLIHSVNILQNTYPLKSAITLYILHTQVHFSQ